MRILFSDTNTLDDLGSVEPGATHEQIEELLDSRAWEVVHLTGNHLSPDEIFDLFEFVREYGDYMILDQAKWSVSFCPTCRPA